MAYTVSKSYKKLHTGQGNCRRVPQKMFHSIVHQFSINYLKPDVLCLVYVTLVICRISVIFTVGTQKRVRLPDQVLIQRFCLIVLLCLAMLVAWTTSQPPKTYAVVTGGGLKFYDCDFGPWEYAALGGMIFFFSFSLPEDNAI